MKLKGSVEQNDRYPQRDGQNLEKSGNKAPCWEGMIAIIGTAVAFAWDKDNLKNFDGLYGHSDELTWKIHQTIYYKNKSSPGDPVQNQQGGRITASQLSRRETIDLR